nr:Smr/MutS family protein [Altererythrobacter sp. KTW20L]
MSHDEAALWARVASTVTPLHPPRNGEGDQAKLGGGASEAVAPVPAPKRIKGRVPPVRAPLHPPAGGPPPRSGEDRGGLDSHWERRLGRTSTEPDFTLDLHGHNLEQAHRRLDDGLIQAKAMGARLVLVVTGKPRTVEAADRGEKRGAIRAKILDWLAAGPHGSDIAAVRPAQRKHGGEGAIYLVLRRPR